MDDIRPIASLPLALLAALLLCAAAPDPARAEADDEYLKGYLTAVLERELRVPRDEYRLEVHDGVATLTLYGDGARRARILQALRDVEGLQGLDLRLAAAPPGALRRRAYGLLHLTPDVVLFPTEDVFRPLLADPKQSQFFVSLRGYESSADTVTTAAVGYGETFGLYRRPGHEPGDGLQVGIAGALFAQFNLDTESNDLVNADYTIGVPVTYRRGPYSGRLRFYHQSSHLGDEFLLNAKPDRINLSFESLELLVSRDWPRWSAYLGGEYLVNREPADLKPAGATSDWSTAGPTSSSGVGAWWAGWT